MTGGRRGADGVSGGGHMGRLLIKICGLTRLEDAVFASNEGADLLGFVFVPNAGRAVDPSAAGWIADLAGRGTVGVFLDAPADEVLEVRRRLHLDRVQLHGDADADLVERLGPDTIVRVDPGSAIDWHRVERLARRCLPLVDPGAGDGVAWRWRDLGRPPPGVAFGVAGGLRPDTVADVVAGLRPAMVDVSSGVERSTGVKDPVLVREFIVGARRAHARSAAAERRNS